MTPFRFFALVLLSALVQPTVRSQTAATQAERPSEQVDKLFEKMDRTISPGCAVAAMRDGKILYQRGYGMADLDHKPPHHGGHRLSRGLDVEAVHRSGDCDVGPGAQAFP